MVVPRSMRPRPLHAAKALAVAYRNMKTWTALAQVICRVMMRSWRAIWLAPSPPVRTHGSMQLSGSTVARLGIGLPTPQTNNSLGSGTRDLCPTLVF